MADHKARGRGSIARTIGALALIAAGSAARAATAATILFVTQPPFGADFATVNAVFGNHQGITEGTPRGGDLYIRYGDGTLRNLTAEAGYGVAGGVPISVREPSVHWTGTRALFSMVIGGTTINNYSSVYFQIYEVSGLGLGQTVQITRLPQPANTNNVSPFYGTDDRILFTADLPRNGDRLTYPQLDEYESTATNTGIWSMNPDGTDVKQLDHAISGNFTPIIAADGRIIFTRWDHLQRDQQSNEGTLQYGAFNYASESSTQALPTSAEIFPELRNQPPGSYYHAHEFNHFFPWQLNEDGSGLETVNHVGRHELSSYFDSANDDLPEFIAPQGRRTADLLLHLKEDPNRLGYFYGTTAPEFGTHAGGQIIGLNGAEAVNADDMQIDYVTDPLSRQAVQDGGQPPAGHPGHFRNPVPLSDGSLLAVHSTSPFADKQVSGLLSSRDDFHLITLQAGTPYRTPGARLIPGGIIKSISYWDNYSYSQLTYDGALWELDPVEVLARPRPTRHVTPLPAIETQILIDELGGQSGIDRLQTFLRSNNLALIISRNVTRRADKQQEYNLKITGSATQTVEPGGTPTEISFMQFLQGDLIRGYSAFHEGRRPIAQLMHDAVNPPAPGAPPSSVQLGADGSMAALVPARRAMTWQLTQADGTPVVRERYWLTFAPGEMRTCTNCHGINRTDVVLGQPPPTNPPEALRDLARWWRANYDNGTTPTATTAVVSNTPTAVPTNTPPPTPSRTATRTPTVTPTRTATRTPTRTPSLPPTATAPPGSFAIGGTVRYYTSSLPVSGVSMQLQGAAASTQPTDANGRFGFNALGGGNWQIVPRMLGGRGSGISALDAVYVLQAAVGQRTLSAQQQLACDVSGNGAATAFDAALILQYKVGIIATLPVAQTCGSDWLFVPAPSSVPNQQVGAPHMMEGSCQAGMIGYQPLTGSANTQDFVAVLFGDCTGNWQSSAGTAALAAGVAPPAVRVGRPRRVRGGVLRARLYVDGSAGFHALEVELAYDPGALRSARVHLVRTAGSVLMQAHERAPGHLAIALASGERLPSGTSLMLDFVVTDRSRSASPIRVLRAAVGE